MTLAEFLENPPKRHAWLAASIKKMKPARKFAEAEFSITQTKDSNLKTRGTCDTFTVDCLQFVFGTKQLLVNGVGPMPWGEAKHQIAAILRCDKTDVAVPSKPVKKITEPKETSNDEIADDYKPSTNASWTNYALLDLINEELGKGNHKTINTRELAERLLAEKK